MAARAVTTHTAQSPAEISLGAGERVAVHNADLPEAGMYRVSTADGKAGLVPAAGVLALERVVGVVLGDFVAESDGELSVAANDEVVLLAPDEEIPNGWALAAMGSAYTRREITMDTAIDVQN